MGSTLQEKKMISQDPVGQICMTGSGIYSWEDVYRQPPPPKSVLDIKEGAFKLCQGYTRITVKDNQWSVFSLAGQKYKKTTRTCQA